MTIAPTQPLGIDHLAAHVLDECNADRGFMSLPSLRLVVKIHIISKEHPFNKLIGRNCTTRRDYQGDVHRPIVLNAAAKTPIHANYVHECVETVL